MFGAMRQSWYDAQPSAITATYLIVGGGLSLIHI